MRQACLKAQVSKMVSKVLAVDLKNGQVSRDAEAAAIAGLLHKSLEK